MSYGLLWIEGLVVSLLWVATAVAVSARIRSRRWAGLFLFAALAVLAMELGFSVAVSAELDFGLGLAENWFGYSLSLFIATFVGWVIILWLARRVAGSRAARDDPARRDDVLERRPGNPQRGGQCAHRGWRDAVSGCATASRG